MMQDGYLMEINKLRDENTRLTDGGGRVSAIKYYALDGDEEVPCEFVVIRNVNGEPEFCASFVNTNYLAYENGALLKLHQRNDELRTENAKLRNLVHILCHCMHESTDCDGCKLNDGRGEMVLDALFACDGLHEMLRETGIEVD